MEMLRDSRNSSRSESTEDRTTRGFLSAAAPLKVLSSTRRSNLVPDATYDYQRLQVHPTSTKTYERATWAILRSFGLALLHVPVARRLRWSDPGLQELPKSVRFRSHRLASVRALIHVIPLTASLVLLFLNGTNQYIGGELTGPSGQDAQKLGGLQFAAKTHELFILSSLAAIVMTHLHRELIFGHGLPFGGIFASHQMKSIDFLWSREFWALASADWRSKSKKWALVTLIAICTLLAVSVGPSSAVLMVPRVEEWPAGGTRFWIDVTRDELFPTVLNATDTMSHCASTQNNDGSCPSSGWESLADLQMSYWRQSHRADARPGFIMPMNVSLAGRRSVRQLAKTQMLPQDSPFYTLLVNKHSYSLATVAMAPVADAVAELAEWWMRAAYVTRARARNRQDVVFSVLAGQPIVYAACKQATISGNQTVLTFQSLRRMQRPANPLNQGRGSTFTNFFTWTDERLSASVNNVLRPELFWLDDTQLLDDLNATSAAIAVIPGSSNATVEAYCCTMDSRFAPARVTRTRQSGIQVEGAPDHWRETATFSPDYTPIAIRSTWAKYLNPIIARTNDTVFSTLMRTAGVWNATQGTPREWHVPIIENALTTLLANGIARSSYNATVPYQLKRSSSTFEQWNSGDDPWFTEMVPQAGFGNGGNIFAFTPDQEWSMTEFRLEVSAIGYAYSSEGRTAKVCMAVLGLYVALVLVHLIYSIMTGWSGGDWGSQHEIAALCLNSERSDKMENTGGGIRSKGVFKHEAAVMAKDGRLQLLFEDTKAGGERVEEGRIYS